MTERPTPFCSECGSVDVFEEVSAVVHTVKGRRVTVDDDRHMRCRACGEATHFGEMLGVSMIAVADRIRAEDGLLTPRELKDIRLRYGFRQEEMEQLVGSGAKTWVRWERGRIVQSRQADANVRRLSEDPVYLRELMVAKAIRNETASTVVDDACMRQARNAAKALRDDRRIEESEASRIESLLEFAFANRGVTPQSNSAGSAAVDVATTIAVWSARIPVDVEGLALDLGLAVYRDPGTGKESSGRIVLDAASGGSSGYAVYVNGREAPVRQRFTIAHEIAHLELHRDRIGDGLTETALHRSPPKGADPMEREANMRAVEILMPKAAVENAFASEQSTRILATRFGVSEESMGWRLYNLKLTSVRPRKS